MHPRGLEACATGSRHGERLQPGLTQRDTWVMHSLLLSPDGRGARGGEVRGAGIAVSERHTEHALPPSPHLNPIQHNPQLTSIRCRPGLHPQLNIAQGSRLCRRR